MDGEANFVGSLCVDVSMAAELPLLTESIRDRVGKRQIYGRKAFKPSYGFLCFLRFYFCN